ncbi:MAG: hypothetical protein HY719_07945 [Planctomycetes bacterium]|nr:hypothetical protein [Planctomycetota bacterium]
MEYDRICDAHVIMGTTAEGVAYARQYEPVRVIELLAEAGMHRAVAVPLGIEEDHAAVNRELSRVCRDYHDLYFLARVRAEADAPAPEEEEDDDETADNAPPPADADDAEAVAEMVATLGAAGFVINAFRDGEPRGALRDAIFDTGLPVLFEVADVEAAKALSPQWTERAARQPVILSNLAACPLYPPEALDAIDFAASTPGIYLDTSRWIVPHVLRHAIREIPERLLFASGAPYADPAVASNAVIRLAAPPADKRRVLSENFLSLLDWGEVERRRG